ncbi:hypothetical protein LINGRAHAP2_LOCUS3877 [Linum grandiflorum]
MGSLALPHLPRS